jgi:hypothetical protein
MPSYQIPQFLDSGDKILGPLNVRQFLYAMVGFFICIVIFYSIQGAIPSLGIFALVPCLPFAGLFGYIALGRYNGRDSEIYVLKSFIYFVKPRGMVYKRQPDVAEVNEKLAKLSYEAITAEWTKRLTEKQAAQNTLFDFDSQNIQTKAAKIRQLGNTLDISLSNTLTQVASKELETRGKQQLLNTLQRGNGLSHSVRLNPVNERSGSRPPQDLNYFKAMPLNNSNEQQANARKI